MRVASTVLVLKRWTHFAKGADSDSLGLVEALSVDRI